MRNITDVLIEQATELRLELDRVEELLWVYSGRPAVETGRRAAAPPPVLQPAIEPAPEPAPEPVRAPQVRPEKRRKSNPENSGSRRAVTLALFTGPLTSRELARALVWNQQKVEGCLNGMYNEKEKLVTVKAGVWSLTEESKTRARWFIENPSYLVYSRRRVEAARTNAVKP